MQCFKFAVLSLFPFGKEIQYGGGAGKFLLNILWLIFGGFELAVAHVIFGIILCCTIIGIPFGLQHFKLAKLALLPFGAEIISKWAKLQINSTVLISLCENAGAIFVKCKPN